MRSYPVLFALLLLALIPAVHSQPYFGNGIKIGETTTDSTIVWLRLTDRAEPKWDGLKWIGIDDREFDEGELGEKQFPAGATIPDMEGSLMGMEGSVRVCWWPEGHPKSKRMTSWLPVDSNQDFTRQVLLEDLQPNQRYELAVESRSVEGKSGQSLSGSFRTALGAAGNGPFRFVISTCQS